MLHSFLFLVNFETGSLPGTIIMSQPAWTVSRLFVLPHVAGDDK
jgi:hypothetical protein